MDAAGVHLMHIAYSKCYWRARSWVIRSATGNGPIAMQKTRPVNEHRELWLGSEMSVGSNSAICVNLDLAESYQTQQVERS
jgi:hypothetical protein